MARFEFDDAPPTVDYVTVPQGRYVCTVAEVAPGTTRKGDPRWGLRLVIAEGEFTGRLAAWDGLVFSEKGTHRARRVLGALGLPNTGEVELDPDDLAGRRAIVEVRPAEYTDPTTGSIVRRNEVPYDGYVRLPDHVEGAAVIEQGRSETGVGQAGSNAGKPNRKGAPGHKLGVRLAAGAGEEEEAPPF